jgi:hypothetical protein
MTPLSASLASDWFGVSHAAAPRFTLSLHEGVISLVVKVSKAALTVRGDDGDYVEGLWEGDCAELFLVNPVSGAYIEFNLSPKGAWWCCEFSGTRTRAPGAPVRLVGVVARGSVGHESWEAALSIPVSALPASLDFNPDVTRGNVTFCLGDDPQRYLTYVDLGGGNPDFHRPGRWVPLFI